MKLSKNLGEIPLVWNKPKEEEEEKKSSKKHSGDLKRVPDKKVKKHRDDEGRSKEERHEKHDNSEKKEDPDKQGVIRTVKGAHLVYKRKNDSGTYDELWRYPHTELSGGGLRQAVEIKRAILSGTDIPVKDTESPDGSQYCEQKIIGDNQFLFISGIPQ